METVNLIEITRIAELEFQYGTEAFEVHQKEAERAMTNDSAIKIVPVMGGKSQ